MHVRAYIQLIHFLPMIMMMNYFYGTVDRWKALRLNSSSIWICVGSEFRLGSCAVIITIAPRCHNPPYLFQMLHSTGNLLEMRALVQSGLNLSWRRSLSYRNQSTDLLWKSRDWFLYDKNLSHETVIIGLKVLLSPLFEAGWLFKDRRQTLVLILSESERINYLLFPQKSS